MHERRYWIGVVSRDHVENAVAHGFVQLNHGKAAPLERMQAGDGFAFYSPRESYPEGATLQAFTAIGSVADAPIYEATMPELGRIFRRDVAFLDATPAPIRPLVPQLTFIRSKTHGALHSASASWACRAKIRDDRHGDGKIRRRFR
jgi:hypothetical protein